MQRRAGDESLGELSSGDKLWLGWSPAAALLLGPVDGVPDPGPAEPVEAAQA